MIKALRQLMLHEGFSPTVYPCTASKRTILYGRNIDANPFSETELNLLGIAGEWEDHYKLTKTDGIAILMLDLEKCQDSFKRIFNVEPNLRCPRDAAICNMIYNLGETRFKNFKNTIVYYGDFVCHRLQGLQPPDLAHATANEMLDSKWAKQVGNRANQLADQMQTGEWQNMADWPQI